jgi:hypothetical protein
VKSKIVYFLLLPLFLVFWFTSCQQAVPSKPGEAIDTINTAATIQQLISKGDKFVSANIDSLPAVSQKLRQLGNRLANKPALTYAELYHAYYLLLSSDHKGAMAAAITCLTAAEKWKINRVIPQVYAIIANVHKENTNYQMAFANANKGLQSAIANRDTAEIIALLGLKAMLTHSVWLNEQKHGVDKSLDFQLAALHIAESGPKYEKLRIRFYDNIAQYYKDNNDFDRAIAYGNKSVPLALKYDQQRSLTYVYTWLGEAHYRKGERAKGLAYLNSALQIAYTIKEPYRVMEIYQALYDCALFSRNYKLAINYTTKFRDMHDSLQVHANVKQIGELQIKYETVKKDAELAAYARSEKIKNREIIVILTGSFLFILFTVILLFQSRVIRRSHQLIKGSNTQLNDALKNIAYIQSHELRKPLASILGLVNVIKAEDYTADKEALHKLEIAAKELDVMIKAINKHTQIK